MLVLDGFISFIPGAADYSYGQLSQDLSNNITGYGETVNGLAVALLGIARLVRGDRRARLAALPARRPQVTWTLRTRCRRRFNRACIASLAEAGGLTVAPDQRPA